MIRCRVIFIALILMAHVAGCTAQRRPAEQVNVVSADVPRFYQALDAAGPGADVERLATALRRDYVTPGTPGLDSWMEARVGSVHDLARVVADRRAYYDSIRPALLAMAADPSVQARVREAFVRLNDWLPDAKFSDTYLLVGRMNSAGTVGSAGLLIGLEMFGRGADTPTKSLDRWAQMTIRDQDELVFTIVHESIHQLQTGGEPRTLLEAAIREGVCDFLASQATGTTRRTPSYEYARVNEARLWSEFRPAMHGTDWGDWLYATPQDTSRPPDLGYAIGAFICEAYCKTMPDKRAAARRLLDTRNAAEILRASGYAPE